LSIAIGHPHKPSEPGWQNVGLVDDKGNEVPKLPNDLRVGLDESLTPRQAAKQIGNWREQAEATERALLEYFQGAEAKAQVTEAAQQIQPAPRPAPVQQQPRQPQVDPLAAQKAHLAAQAAALQMSGEQKQILENQQAWINHLRKNCPEADNIQSWNYTV